MKDRIFITGHKNPDTDSICSSIAYAALKQELGYDAVAMRNGDLNTETMFALKRFDVEIPEVMTTATSALKDIEYDEIIKVKGDYTIRETWDAMVATLSRNVFVVDDQNVLIGLVTMSALSNVMMMECVDIRKLMAQTPLENIKETIKAELIYKSKNYHSDGKVHILVSSNLLDENVDFNQSIVVVGNNRQLQARAISEGAKCLIIVENNPVYFEILELARKFDCAILQTPLTTIYTARLIYMSVPIHLLMTQSTVNFYENDMVNEVTKIMAKTRYRSYPVLDSENHALGAVSRYHMLNYKKKKIILLDHNEMSQSLENIHDGEIIEIVDHHRIGDIETLNPINFRNQTLGSTSTIISLIYKENNIEPKPKIAALMCCAIISDTMNFNSPTTTPTDKIMAQQLAKIANIELDDLAKEMFEAVATLKGKTYSEILYNDFKEFHLEGYRVAIGQINIVQEEELDEIRDEFKTYLRKINSVNHYDILMVVFTNVDASGSRYISVGKFDWVIIEAFKNHIDTNNYLAGIISRKKQIVPALKAELANV